MEEKLRAFLMQYVGQGVLKKDKVQEDDVDMLVFEAVHDHIEQEIIDYGTAHPEAMFWDLLELLKPMTPEEIEAAQREIDSEPDEEWEGIQAEVYQFLLAYVGRKDPDLGVVQEKDVNRLVFNTVCNSAEQKIVDYGATHPKASFSDFYKLLKPLSPKQREVIEGHPDYGEDVWGR